MKQFKKSTNGMLNPNETCMLYVSKVSCSSVAHPSSMLLCTEHLQQKKHHSDSAKLTKKSVGTRNMFQAFVHSWLPILAVTQHFVSCSCFYHFQCVSSLKHTRWNKPNIASDHQIYTISLRTFLTDPLIYQQPVSDCLFSGILLGLGYLGHGIQHVYKDCATA